MKTKYSMAQIISFFTYPIAGILYVIDDFVENNIFVYISLPLFVLSLVLSCIQLSDIIRENKLKRNSEQDKKRDT
jgi:hypothetical protein